MCTLCQCLGKVLRIQDCGGCKPKRMEQGDRKGLSYMYRKGTRQLRFPALVSFCTLELAEKKDLWNLLSMMLWMEKEIGHE